MRPARLVRANVNQSGYRTGAGGICRWPRFFCCLRPATIRLYVGSEATASELALLEFESEEDAKAALPLAQERLASQKESFASYVSFIVRQYETAFAVGIRN